jgi:SAM-dependent methyltransferase
VDREFEAPHLLSVMDEAVRYNRFLLDQIRSWCGEHGSVLDFGAGNGRFCGALHESGVHVSAVEPDPELRRQIVERGVSVHESLAAVDEKSLDGIYSINVLEHIEDDSAVLSMLFDALKPGGRLFLYVPAFPILFTSNDVLVGHVRRYKRADLIERVLRAGFQVESARYVDSIGFPVTLLYRFFGAKDGNLDARAVRFYDAALFPISRFLDRLFGRVLGKNLLLRATRPPEARWTARPANGTKLFSWMV